MALIHYAQEDLTDDGGTNGVITVADTASFVAGAMVWLNSDTVDGKELEIDEIIDATTMFVSDPSVVTFDRFDASAYTTADNAVITQNQQDNNEASYEVVDTVAEASAEATEDIAAAAVVTADAAAVVAAAALAATTAVTSIVTCSAATYTVLSTDNKKHILFTAAGGCVVTVPVTLLAGFQCSWEQRGAAQVSFSGVAVAAATLQNRSTQTKSAGVYAVGGLSCSSGTGANAVVTLFGDTGA